MTTATPLRTTLSGTSSTARRTTTESEPTMKKTYATFAILLLTAVIATTSGRTCPDTECPAGSKAACILDGNDCNCKCVVAADACASVELWCPEGTSRKCSSTHKACVCQCDFY
ncbi:hypothetical protein V5799_032175 [Amblyomma americanum]|uniref:Uncharacterized protein n=1 Tax=Amblyomma americanum TaxID=6943 RepID=A0AAQ4DRX7_AMBAM